MWIKYKWGAVIIDIETAFLYGNLDEEIYLKIPSRYERNNRKKIYKNDCLILNQAIYGLEQAARQFFKKIVEVIEMKIDFIQSMNDKCLLMKNDKSGTIIICLHIDDTLYVSD